MSCKLLLQLFCTASLGLIAIIFHQFAVCSLQLAVCVLQLVVTLFSSWLGLFKNQDDGFVRWADDKEMNFINWDEGEPNYASSYRPVRNVVRIHFLSIMSNAS